MMEFEDLQKIWDVQSNQPLYAINEDALYKRIISKKKQAGHIANISELLLIVVNLGVGSFILAVGLAKQPAIIFMDLTAAWMFATAFYLLVSRHRRIKGERRFDRSMLGSLNHAISMANYQVRLSQIMRWNGLAVGVLILLSAWEGRKLFWVLVVIGISFVVAYYFGNREHNLYKARKRELEVLQKKLEATN